jgi:GTP cyclohydrolase I
MANANKDLGREVHAMLLKKGLENPIDWDLVALNKGIGGISNMEVFAEGFCRELGLSKTDSSTMGTPRRLAKMYHDELCWGLDYDNFPDTMLTETQGQLNEMVVVKNIEVKSLCEHHFMPVLGRAHVAYISSGSCLGLSKFNRIVQFFSRRPQLQERLVQQIQHTLMMVLETEDVAVIIDAEHFCVKFRGVEDTCSSTATSCMGGRFLTKPEVRAELMALIQMGGK